MSHIGKSETESRKLSMSKVDRKEAKIGRIII